MGDGTVLNPGVSGDTVYDEVLDGDNVPTGVATQKMPVSKIALGARQGGLEGTASEGAGTVGASNPLPVYSERLEQLLVQQNAILMNIFDLLSR